jgi:hypothetical protein
MQIERRQCFCVRWQKNFAKLQASVLAAKRQGVPYEGEMFDNCPWCGEPLSVHKDAIIHAGVAAANAGGLASGG